MTGCVLPRSLLILSFAAAIPGCVPIYSAIDSARAPAATPLKMFDWDSNSADGTSQDASEVALLPSETPGEWLLCVQEIDGISNRRPMVINDRGEALRVGQHLTKPYNGIRTAFCDDPASLDAAGVSYEIDDRTFPRVLETESWMRVIVFAPLFPFYGKSTESMMNGPPERRSWFPPRLTLTLRLPDGSTASTLYELPDTDNPFYDVDVSVSEDHRFLYISYDRHGRLIRLGE